MVNSSLKDCRIVFMGTPEFAVASLQALVEAGYTVAAVVTSPDKPAGRGLLLQPSPVKQYALAQGITVLQPVKLREEAFLHDLQQLNADLFIVVAFRMIPEAVWHMPRLGTFNLHASLLPKYRGAAPINWAIINGEAETGVTTFFIDENIDTGKILLSEKVKISPDDTAGTLHDTLKVVGKMLTLKTVDAIANGCIQPVPQESTCSADKIPTAPKLFKDTCRISWQKKGFELVNFIRGLSPYPAAWCELAADGAAPQPVKVFAAHAEPTFFAENPPQPGALLTDGRSFLKAACADGFLCIDELQLSGKKRMTTEAFLRGVRGNFKAWR
ncbi:MAG: methionyl-tRNA formyltransferase [Prevotellaceae bacterium]|jgi:methionyl-tRNA formyltransferase|nr:methionyl-tRNA formyltransferase [Prevotellaceae bacterium]